MINHIQTYIRENASPNTQTVQFLDTQPHQQKQQLLSSGYTETGRLPLLTCTPTTLRDASPVAGIEIITTSASSPFTEVAEAWNTNALGYDMNAPSATKQQVEEFRQLLHKSRAFTARLHGQAVAAGMFTDINKGITQLVGITTLTPFRRQGIATYLTAYITQTAFHMGCQMTFLVAENEPAGRIYQRLGYAYLADMVTMETHPYSHSDPHPDQNKNNPL